jgi:hypothetical protein
MWYILEIIIIVFAGLASAAFLARYFFISSRIKKQFGCSNGCSGGCGTDKNEIFSKILKDNKKLNRKV